MKRLTHYSYIITPAQEQAVAGYLRGEVGVRELARIMERGNASTLAAVAGVCRQWVQEGKLMFEEGR